MVSNIAWHIPGVYELALGNVFWHRAEHVCFLVTALLFWWPVIQPWPSRAVWPRWAMVPYLLIADLQNTALAAFLTFSERVLYPSYGSAPRISELSVLDDQAGAGAIMWVPGSMAFLLPAGAIALSYLSPRRVVPVAAVRLPAAPRITRPFDLLRVPLIGRVMRWKFFRPSLQAAMFVLALAVIADGLFGPQVSTMNLAGVLPWTHWRGLTVIALLAAGNLFCMVCPFTFFRDFGRRFLPGGRRWPRMLRTKWLAAGLLAAFFWAYEFFDLWDSPWLTAWVIAAYFAAAFLIDGFFRGASFCKFVCPIGQFHFLGSLASPLEVRVREPAVCAECRTRDCLRGNEGQRGCELGLFQPRKSGNMDCTFCMDCVQACPHDNVGLLLAKAGADVIEDPAGRSSVGGFSRRSDIAVLAGVFVAGAFVNAAAMTAPLAGWQRDVGIRLGEWGSGAFVALVYAVMLLLLPGLAGLACGGISCRLAGLAGRAGEVARGFSVALAPLGFSMWVAHFGFHFLTGFFTPVPVAGRVAGELGMRGVPVDWQVPTLAFPGLPGLQILILNVGVLFSLWMLWRKSLATAGRRAGLFVLPWALLALGLYAVGLWIIFQPMELRGLRM
jgi:ferredoxin